MSFIKPTAAQQRRRLNAKFLEIAESFHSVQSSVQGLEPEQVLVLEAVGDSVAGLAKAAGEIPGLEWLAEMDLDDVEPAGGFVDAIDPGKSLPCRLYAVMTNQEAMDRLVNLWNEWCGDPQKRARSRFGPFKNLFINLRDLRRWNAEDRIEATGVRDYLKERLDKGTEEIRFEIELWCRNSPEARDSAYEIISNLVSVQGGECLTQSAVPEICYHGVLVKMPASSVQETVDGILTKNYGPLIRCEHVMFLRPFAQAGFITEETDSREDLKERFSEKPGPSGDPILAILDGLPLEHHETLDGRLVIDDPDEISSYYSPTEQQHGTAMASLVVHGDLNRDEEPLKSPVYVRPILTPKKDFENHIHEFIPDNELLIDVIHRSVRNLFEGESPAAPKVKLINLSVANSFQPFDRELSPLARLIDWLSWKYKILFLLSVGNHAEDITLKITCSEWGKLTEEERCSATLKALHSEQLNRRSYSPAESVNALTVGALHADNSTPPWQGRRVDLLPGKLVPSPIGTVSSGHRRSVKPEIFFPGGIQLYREPIGNPDAPASFKIAPSSIPPGHKVAAPVQVPLELARTMHSRGTSNATALASRCSGKIYERILELRDEPGGDRLDEADLAVLIKCLLVHGASWGEGADLLESVFQPDIESKFDANHAWREMHRIQCRFLGYGEVSPDVSTYSTDERVTIVGWSQISNNEGNHYQIPLPPVLSGSHVRRRLTGTLAWLTPINPQHQHYREAKLWFSLDETKLGVRHTQVYSDPARRGTVEHRILEGESVIAFDEGEELEITVSCKGDAGKLTQSIPYALAISLEVAEKLEESIFEQVRDRIQPRIEITAQG